MASEARIEPPLRHLLLHRPPRRRSRHALHEAGAGTAKIVFPTLRNLERLAAYPTFEAAKAHVETVEVRPISTYIEEDEQGEKWACIPPDSGYPVTRQLLSELLAP